MKPLNARFQEYYTENYPIVHRTALSIIKERTSADDVAEEVFTCLYEYLSRENPPSEQVRPWLLVTAKCRAYHYLRGGLPVPTEPAQKSEDPIRTDPAPRLLASELLDALYRRSPKWFDIVGKYYELGLSAEEIAREYRCTPRDVLDVLSRARIYLREIFGDDLCG